jgi:uncharacterized Fe-S cluster protein YjdI/CDGSH-type Zn-finger protein
VASCLRERAIRYKGGKIDIYFFAGRCTHVAECLRGAPAVFDSMRRPWIVPDAEEPDSVAQVIERCPTGALHYKRKDGGQEEIPPPLNSLSVQADGPIYFHGQLKLQDAQGGLLLEETRLALCRCGLSGRKPLCDDSHEYEFTDDGDLPEHKSLEAFPVPEAGAVNVIIKPAGPLVVEGPFLLWDSGRKKALRLMHAVLCRCGASRNKPFCDGSHSHAGFTGD